MSALTQAEATKWLNNIKSRTLQVGLFLTSSTEVSGAGYARQSVLLSNPEPIPGTGVRAGNQGDISFGAAGATWAASPNKITWVKVFDTADGAAVWGGELPATMQMSLLEGQPYEIKAGMLSLLIRTYD